MLSEKRTARRLNQRHLWIPGQAGMGDLVDLAFHRAIFTEFATHNGLLVMAPGLGARSIFEALISLYADEKCLVLLLGLDAEEEEQLQRYFTAGEDQLVGRIPFNILANETGGDERVRAYASGGVVSVTSRILVTDMLTQRLPFHLVTGLLFWGTERLTENGLEAFAMYMLRQANPEVFIQAISEAPEAFVRGFSQLDKMVKWMQMPPDGVLLLYPRFHVHVKEELDDAPITAEELLVRPSARTSIAQMALLELVEATSKELAKLNPWLELDDVIVDVQLLRQQLEPVWHTTGFKTRQLVAELQTLRSLLAILHAYDAVSFLIYLENVLATGDTDNWLVMDAANSLIQAGKDRVAAREIPPKWTCLLAELQTLATEDKDEEVLILVANEAEKKQIEALLELGPAALTNQLHEAYAARKQRVKMKPTPRWPTRKRARRMPTVAVEEQVVVAEQAKAQPREPLVNVENIKVLPLSKDALRMLQAHKPSIIIQYSQRLPFIRSLELHATLTKKPLTLLSMYHQDSSEEQAYLLAVRQEKEAFEDLIKARAQLVLTNTQTQSQDDAEAYELVDSRLLNIQSSGGRRPLIVDMRDLRAALPFVLHRTGAFDLRPVTLPIADYLLTPSCAIERKSIPDLIQSLASGRLYTQAEALCRTYALPMLLIEWDESRRAFSLLGQGDLRADINGSDLISRLCLLLLHFPKLRLIWSSSLQATAEIFSDLQQGHPDPSTTSTSDIMSEEEAYNLTPEAILEAMPGVTQQNIYLLMNACTSLKHLCTMGCSDIQEIIGEASGRALYDFLHNQPKNQ